MLLITSLLWLLSSRQQININTADTAAAAAHNDNEDDCLFLLLLLLPRYQRENRVGSSRTFIIISELPRVKRAASVTCLIIPFSIHLCYWCRFAEWLYQWRRTRFYIHVFTHVYIAAGNWIFENIVECEVNYCSCFEEKATAGLFAIR